MINFLATGTILGLSAGLSPGPLLTLVISETLKHNMKAGVKVALAPILTDLPIIILTLFIMVKLSSLHVALGVISFLGGFFILYMGYESICTKRVNKNLEDCKPKPLIKGMIVNILNPHPYLFWFSVGAPTTIKAWDRSAFAAIAFIGSFYVLLVGSKIFLAIFVGRSQSLLTGSTYIYTMRFLGIILFTFAAFLFHDGLALLGVL